MLNPWRPLVIAAVVSVTVGVGVARAQTVVVTNAPQGSTVELVLNGTAVGSAKVDSAGFATIPVNLVTQLKKRETDVYVYVETCGDARRVIMAERGQQPAAAPSDCDRRDMGLFLLRRVSTVVVNAGGPTPTVLLVQGRFDPRDPRPIRPWNSAPTGLILTGGGGLMRFSDVESIACGDVTDCSGGGFKPGYTVGATYWITPYAGAEVSFVRPAEITVDGAGTGFEFASSFDVRVLTIAGKGAVPAGPVRVYGKGGGSFQQATFTTTQTDTDAATTEERTQTFELKTEGWGWLFGGGIEVWIKRNLGVYAEATFLKLKGSPVDNAEGTLNDRIMSIVIGGHVHIGR